MELTTIRELYKNSDSYMDQKVTIGGWVRSIRGSKAFGFIVVNDGTDQEREQLNEYHKKVYEIVAPHLSDEEREWLRAYTRAI